MKRYLAIAKYRLKAIAAKIRQTLVGQCINCNSWKRRSEMAAKLEMDYCCLACAVEHNGPGKFENYYTNDNDEIVGYLLDLEDLGKAIILYNWMMAGSEEESMSNEGWGYCGRFSNFLAIENSDGFFTFEEYETVKKAEIEFNRYYRDGWGASEDDAYLSSDGTVYFNGKTLDVWTPQNTRWDYDDTRGISDRRRIARVRLEAMKTGYYPNLWAESDHGNLTLIEY